MSSNGFVMLNEAIPIGRRQKHINVFLFELPDI